MSYIWNSFKRAHSSIDVLADVFRFARSDVQGARKYNVPLGKRIKAWRHGFTAKSWVWLDLDHNDPDEYINNIHARRVIPTLNGKYGGVFDDDVAFFKASQDFEDQLPKIYGLILSGRYLHTTGEIGTERLDSIIDKNEFTILKPICGNQGQGVYKVRSTENGYSVNGSIISPERLQTLITALDDYVVMEYVSQHEYSAVIYPDSTNTIRFITGVDPATQDAHILSATHRFGTPRSAPTDNWSGGGLCAPIRDDGTMGQAVNQDGRTSIERTETHPATGQQIEGIEIPWWEESRTLVHDIATHHNRAKYVGWDVVLTSEGPVIIEANSNPGINLPQMDGGLLTDPIARRIFNDTALL